MRAIGALDHRPFCLFLDADFFQQRRQSYAGPFGATDHAVAELQRVHLRGAPVHAAIGRAFDEMDARYRWKAKDVLHGEQQRPLDEPVNHQLVLRRIDVGPARMVALEEQSIGRDDAVQFLQRRKAHRRFRAGGEPGDVAPDDGGFGIRRPAVGPVDHACADRLRPGGIGGRRRRRGVGHGGFAANGEAAGQHCAEPEKAASSQRRVRAGKIGENSFAA